MNSPAPTQPTDLKRRLRELLSVPERDRTDEQWDEIVELEIQLAPGNRIAGPAGNSGGGGGGGGNQGGNQNVGGGNQPSQARKHRPRGNNRRPNKPKPPQA